MKTTTFWMGLSFLMATALFAVAQQATDRGSEGQAEALFDGKSLEGWSGNSKFWSVQDGAITGQTTAENPTDGNTFLIWQGGELGDFELRLKYRIDGGNSGVQYRSRDLGEFVVGGYQADIDAGNQYTGILYEERGRRILAGRGQTVVIDADGQKALGKKTCDEKALLKSIEESEWNEYVIRAEGNHLTQTLNGHTTIDLTDNQSDKAAKSGILALQLHQGPPMKIQFKDIRLTRLK